MDPRPWACEEAQVAVELGQRLCGQKRRLSFWAVPAASDVQRGSAETQRMAHSFEAREDEMQMEVTSQPRHHTPKRLHSQHGH